MIMLKHNHKPSIIAQKLISKQQDFIISKEILQEVGLLITELTSKFDYKYTKLKMLRWFIPTIKQAGKSSCMSESYIENLLTEWQSTAYNLEQQLAMVYDLYLKNHISNIVQEVRKDFQQRVVPQLQDLYDIIIENENYFDFDELTAYNLEPLQHVQWFFDFTENNIANTITKLLENSILCGDYWNSLATVKKDTLMLIEYLYNNELHNMYTNIQEEFIDLALRRNAADEKDLSFGSRKYDFVVVPEFRTDSSTTDLALFKKTEKLVDLYNRVTQEKKRFLDKRRDKIKNNKLPTTRQKQLTTEYALLIKPIKAYLQQEKVNTVNWLNLCKYLLKETQITINIHADSKKNERMLKKI